MKNILKIAICGDEKVYRENMVNECGTFLRGERMEHIAELGGIVTGFNVTEHCIDCMCGKNLVKINKRSGEIICQKTIFEKEGLSRKLTAYEEQIFIYDFCTLYVLNRKNYELIGKWQLGNDLSSDICGIEVDSNTIYCSIRNGKIITPRQAVLSDKGGIDRIKLNG